MFDIFMIIFRVQDSGAKVLITADESVRGDYGQKLCVFQRN